MNSSGIVRKIDELGRIVIPVEIRKTLGIKEGEALEFLLNDECIMLKKKSLSKQYISLIEDIEKSLSPVIDGEYLITDREKVIYSSNSNLLDYKLDKSLLDCLSINDEYLTIRNTNIASDKDVYVFIYSIDNSVAGLIVLYDINDVSKYTKLIKFITTYVNDLLSIS